MSDYLRARVDALQNEVNELTKKLDETSKDLDTTKKRLDECEAKLQIANDNYGFNYYTSTLKPDTQSNTHIQ